jgi:hypothetical protein
VIPTVLRDALPRQLAYAVSGARLSREFKYIEGLEQMGLFYLFTSGVQLDFYDPIVSPLPTYPVLALDDCLPQLTSSALEALRRKTGRKKELFDFGVGELFSLRGAMRAQAQLMGRSVAELEEDEDGDGEMKLCDVSICVFPVKARLRRRVSRAILDTAIQPVRNWLSATRERAVPPRPLVILFDEMKGTVMTKFADEWIDPSAPRYYK